jgi:hypothetical protein
MPDHQDLVIHPVAIDTILTMMLATPRPLKESLPSWGDMDIDHGIFITAGLVGIGMFS